METKFNFNSQICTNKIQSERLLALGIKKETADCRHWAYTKDSKGSPIPKRNQRWFTRIGTDESVQVCGFMSATFIPAWSLGRLLELIKHSDICNYNDFGCIKLYIDLDDFETCITMISYMIKEGYFNKEYLV